MAIPEEVEFLALNVDEAAQWLNENKSSLESTMVLMETVMDALRLFDAGHPFPRLNIGNVHHAPGRRPITNAVYLGDEDIEVIKALSVRGVRSEIRSLPSEAAHDASALLEGH
jgi:PTS system N-acetylgalactosamine-specific IIB component